MDGDKLPVSANNHPCWPIMYWAWRQKKPDKLAVLSQLFQHLTTTCHVQLQLIYLPDTDDALDWQM